MRWLTIFICTFLLTTLAAKPFFQASKEQPFHLSVGAVLFNQRGEVACHHFTDLFGHKDIYILMRESMEDGETILETLARGLKEEFGATATPIAYLGCLSGFLDDVHLSFEKTTLYIACQLEEFHPELRDPNDPEAMSQIEWHEPQKLIEIMQSQGERFRHRVDADESIIIQRALNRSPILTNDSKAHLQ